MNKTRTKYPQGLRQRELCVHLGWDYKAVATIAKQHGVSTHQYIQARTGWILYQEYYYPPDTKMGILHRTQEE